MIMRLDDSYAALGVGVYLGYMLAAGFSWLHVLYATVVALACVIGWAIADVISTRYRRRTAA